MQFKDQILFKLHQFGTSVGIESLSGMYMLMKRYNIDLLINASTSRNDTAR